MRKKHIGEEPSDLATREQALATMNGPLQDVAKDIQKKLNGVTKGTLLAYHDVGTLVDQVLRDEVRYGHDALSLLAQFLGVSDGERTLGDLREFAREYPREYIAEEIKKPMANGDCVSYSHFVTLMKISSREYRAELLTRIRAECLSVADVRREIAGGAYPVAKKRGSGRKMKRPTSPIAGLHRLSVEATRITKLAPLLDDAVFIELQTLAPAKVNEKMLEGIDSAKTAAGKAIAAFTDMLGKLDNTKERLQRVLTARTKEKAKHPRPVAV